MSLFVFFFKQKTAYEMRISDWSSDVCSSDLNTCNGADDCRRAVRLQIGRGADVIKFASTGGVNSRIGAGLGKQMFDDEARAIVETAHMFGKKEIGRAWGRERGCE